MVKRANKQKDRQPLPDGDYLAYKDVAAGMGISTEFFKRLLYGRIIPKPRNWGKMFNKGKIPRRYALALVDSMVVRESVPDLRSWVNYRKYFWKKLFMAR